MTGKKTDRKRKIKIPITKCQNMPRSVKACTEVSPSIPLRARKDEYQTSTKLISTRKVAMMYECPEFLNTIITCRAPTKVSHGKTDAFSIGSQAQKPPKLSDS